MRNGDSSKEFSHALRSSIGTNQITQLGEVAIYRFRLISKMTRKWTLVFRDQIAVFSMSVGAPTGRILSHNMDWTGISQ